MSLGKDERVCPVCGEHAVYGSLWVCAHGPEDTPDMDDEVVYEWGYHGTYCRRHLMALCNAVVQAMPLPDRYDPVSHEERVAMEVDMIRRYEKEHNDE